jgi:hypothetical protein
MPFGGVMENLATFNEKHALPPARNIQEGINNIITAGLLSAFKASFKAYCAPCNGNQEDSQCNLNLEN